MKQFLQQFLSGVSLTMPSLSKPRDYPKYEGFARDAQNLGGDWSTVGADMRVALKKEKATRQNRTRIRG